jgi:hypothetical protein
MHIAIHVSQQCKGLLQLHAMYVSWFRASGSLLKEADNAVALETSVLSVYKKYLIKLNVVNTVLNDLGNFGIDAMDEVGVEAIMLIVKDIAYSIKLICWIPFRHVFYHYSDCSSLNSQSRSQTGHRYILPFTNLFTTHSQTHTHARIDNFCFGITYSQTLCF